MIQTPSLPKHGARVPLCTAMAHRAAVCVLDRRHHAAPGRELRAHAAVGVTVGGGAGAEHDDGERVGARRREGRVVRHRQVRQRACDGHSVED